MQCCLNNEVYSRVFLLQPIFSSVDNYGSYILQMQSWEIWMF